MDSYPNLFTTTSVAGAPKALNTSIYSCNGDKHFIEIVKITTKQIEEFARIMVATVPPNN